MTAYRDYWYVTPGLQVKQIKDHMGEGSAVSWWAEYDMAWSNSEDCHIILAFVLSKYRPTKHNAALVEKYRVGKDTFATEEEALRYKRERLSECLDAAILKVDELTAEIREVHRQLNALNG